MNTYKASKGATFNDEDAEKLGSVLEKIGFSAKPKEVVDSARPKASPIHHLFEWDDSQAAERYRLFQARNHVNHLQIIIKTDGGEVKTRAFHSVVITKNDGSHERAYCQMDNVAENADLRAQVISKALAELNGWRARYGQYKKIFGGVFDAIEKAEAKINGTPSRNGKPKKQGRKRALAAR